MSDHGVRSPVEELAERFLASQRRGERPSVVDYAREHPQLASEILEVFPAMLMLEAARPRSARRFESSSRAVSMGAGIAPAASPATDSGEVDSGEVDRPAGSIAAPVRRLGDYRVVREIARGGMGVVYEAIQESLGRRVAVKVLPPECKPDSDCLKRFRREARAAARLHHTNIVPVFDVDESDGAAYYAMQFIDGRGLDEILYELRRRRQRTEVAPSGGGSNGGVDPAAPDELTAQLVAALETGRFPAAAAELSPQTWSDAAPPEFARPRCPGGSTPRAAHGDGTGQPNAAFSPECNPLSSGSLRSGRTYYQSVAGIGLQVAEALAYAHSQRLLHRDIKPSNLLLDLGGTAWVTDFGLVRDEDELLTRTGDIVGTLRYLAPERLNGESDELCDIYSLGLTLYELVAAQPAFADTDRRRLVRKIAEEEPARLKKVDPHVPRDLETIVHKAAAKEPARRYGSAAALAEDLRRFLADRPIRARRAGIGERMWRWRRRNRALAATIGLLLLSFFAGFAGVAWKWREAEHARQREHQALDVAEQRAAEIQQGLDNFKSASSLFERGRWYINEQRWDDAYLALNRAVTLRPDFTAVWIERGELLARLGLFDLASRDFTQAFVLNDSDNATRWYWHALLRMYDGDVAGYRQVCQEMERRFGGTLHPGMAAEACRAAMLCPESTATAAKYSELHSRLIAMAPDYWHFAYVAGLIKLRQGDQAAAVQWLDHARRCQPEMPESQIALPPLAIAYANLRQDAESRAALQQATAVQDRWLEQRAGLPEGNSRRTLGATTQWPVAWSDWLEFQIYFREAELQIDGATSADYRQRHLLRARAFGGLRWHFRSAFEYARALAKEPSDRQVRWEAYRSWGYAAAAVRLWSPAAVSFTWAHQLTPDDSDLGLLRGACHFAAGNRSEYRSACEEVLARGAETSDPRTARNISTLFLLADGAVSRPEAVVSLASKATRHYYDGELHLAGVLYRAGRYEDAVAAYRMAPAAYSRRAADLALTSMAHWRTGRRTEAKSFLSQAEQWVLEADANGLDDPRDARPAWGGMDERIATPRLVQEARGLIRGSAGLEPAIELK